MTQILLNGELVRMKSCKLSLTQDLVSKDVSGQSSSTADVEQGDKSKEIKVDGLIPFTDTAQLTRIFELASARDEAGNRQINRVSSTLTRAAKIRQMKFCGQISAPEHGSLMAWQVSFRLREYLSVPEVAEQRTEQTEANAEQTTEQTASVSSSKALTENAPPNVEVSSLESFLHTLDDSLAETETA
ncbi:baseplate complex protein [Shewanella surugensis]|uniref:DNA-binding protein n=1 Tax=Shewanella surugensis TaxID=212020 RepID=A0ABT0L8L0_9GAMM|nr:DNA-binding protein [Shewanella surugensis]MCL1123516.1 DNA-binding protein [Shewanella surugensis]